MRRIRPPLIALCCYTHWSPFDTSRGTFLFFSTLRQFSSDPNYVEDSLGAMAMRWWFINGFGSGYPFGHREPSNQKTTSLSTEHCEFLSSGYLLVFCLFRTVLMLFVPPSDEGLFALVLLFNQLQLRGMWMTAVIQRTQQKGTLLHQFRCLRHQLIIYKNLSTSISKSATWINYL